MMTIARRGDCPASALAAFLVFGFRRNKFRQSADFLTPVGQEGHILVCLQALTFEQIEQTAFGFGIISMHQTDVAGVTVFR